MAGDVGRLLQRNTAAHFLWRLSPAAPYTGEKESILQIISSHLHSLNSLWIQHTKCAPFSYISQVDAWTASILKCQTGVFYSYNWIFHIKWFSFGNFWTWNEFGLCFGGCGCRWPDGGSSPSLSPRLDQVIWSLEFYFLEQIFQLWYSVSILKSPGCSQCIPVMHYLLKGCTSYRKKRESNIILQCFLKYVITIQGGTLFFCFRAGIKRKLSKLSHILRLNCIQRW